MDDDDGQWMSDDDGYDYVFVGDGTVFLAFRIYAHSVVCILTT